MIMSALDKLDKKTLRDLLNKGWMTHDAMWFATSVSIIGIEKTNVINRRACRSMAKVEAKRLKTSLGFNDGIKDFVSLRKFIDQAFNIIGGDFLNFKITFPRDNVMLWETVSCFAHDGVKKLGFIDSYDCGIFDRVEGWFETLEIRFNVSPEIPGCLMYKTRQCMREYRFYFD